MANKPKKLSEEQILNQIRYKAKQAAKFSTDTIANKQEQALRLYNRDPLKGDAALKGQSKYVDPSVMERVDWSVASAVRVFDGVERVVEFLPNGAEDEPLAKQQTDVINLIVRRLNSHVAMLLPWLKNGFLTGLGVTTVRYDECVEEDLPQEIKGVTDDQLVDFDEQEQAGQIVFRQIGSEYEVDVVEGIADEMGQQLPLDLPLKQKVRDLEVRRITKTRHMKILNIKPEDFVVSNDADFDQQSGGIKAHLQGHRRLVTRDELIELGFDKEKVEKIASASDDDAGMAIERSKATDYDQGTGDTADEVEVYELYTKMKIDGEKARHYRITLGGDLESSAVLLDYVETTKTYPYAAFCPYPLPNTLFGHGVADRVGDDQILLSKIRRAEINNLNWLNHPTKIINQTSTNMDDARNIFPGSTIRSDAPDGGIKFLVPPNTAGTAAPMTADIKTTLDFTTGVGGAMVAVNASDMQNTTATATSQRANSAQQFMETIFRFFADTGYRYLFRIITDLLIQNPEDAEVLIRRITNNYVPIRVDQFSPDLDITTTVAFGVMNKDFNSMMLQQILGIQQSLMGTGSPMIKDGQTDAWDAFVSHHVRQLGQKTTQGKGVHFSPGLLANQLSKMPKESKDVLFSGKFAKYGEDLEKLQKMASLRASAKQVGPEKQNMFDQLLAVVMKRGGLGIPGKIKDWTYDAYREKLLSNPAMVRELVGLPAKQFKKGPVRKTAETLLDAATRAGELEAMRGMIDAIEKDKDMR